MFSTRLPETASEVPGQFSNLAADPGETRNPHFEQAERRERMHALLAELSQRESGRTEPTGRRPIGIANIPPVGGRQSAGR